MKWGEYKLYFRPAANNLGITGKKLLSFMHEQGHFCGLTFSGSGLTTKYWTNGISLNGKIKEKLVTLAGPNGKTLFKIYQIKNRRH